MTQDLTTARSSEDALIEKISALLSPLGLEVVALEVQNSRQKTLRLFIDFVQAQDGKAIGIEDCVQATKLLDEPLDAMPEVNKLFSGTWELEVSSPGLERPLRRPQDYERFSGKEVRIHVFRPLTGDEMGNSAWQTKNPKQKNFLGVLRGFQQGAVLLSIAPDGGHLKKPGKSKKSAKNSETENKAEEVRIPLPLISKAHLEPDFSELAVAETNERNEK